MDKASSRNHDAMNGNWVLRNSYRGIDPMIVRIAKSNARKVIGKHGFTDSDLADLEQEFVQAGLKIMEQFDPDLGDGGGLIQAAVKHRLGSIIAYHRAGKRDWRKLASLHEELPGGEDEDEGSTLIDYVASCGHLGPFDAEERNPVGQFQRCQDINAAISRLPPEYRDLCNELKFMTPDELMAKHNLSHSIFYKHLAKIRRFFLYFLGEDEFGNPPRPDHRPVINWKRE